MSANQETPGALAAPRVTPNLLHMILADTAAAVLDKHNLLDGVFGSRLNTICVDLGTALSAAVGEQIHADANAMIEAARADRQRLVRELDIALNGAVGAAEQVSMCDLISQVTRQQCVQIVNMPDGMRINFRAPDGRRGTLNVSTLINYVGDGAFLPGVAAVMRDAIAAYPLTGVPQ